MRGGWFVQGISQFSFTVNERVIQFVSLYESETKLKVKNNSTFIVSLIKLMHWLVKVFLLQFVEHVTWRPTYVLKKHRGMVCTYIVWQKKNLFYIHCKPGTNIYNILRARYKNFTLVKCCNCIIFNKMNHSTCVPALNFKKTIHNEKYGK